MELTISCCPNLNREHASAVQVCSSNGHSPADRVEDSKVCCYLESASIPPYQRAVYSAPLRQSAGVKVSVKNARQTALDENHEDGSHAYRDRARLDGLAL